MRQLLDIVIQIVLTTAVVWAAIHAMQASGLFITKAQAYRSITAVK